MGKIFAGLEAKACVTNNVLSLGADNSSEKQNENLIE